MKITLKIWRQKNVESAGKFIDYEIKEVSPDSSFLEMIDVLNEEFCRQIGYQKTPTGLIQKDVCADWLVVNKKLSTSESELLIQLKEAGIKIASSIIDGDLPIIEFVDGLIVSNSMVVVNLSKFTIL